MDDWTVWAMFAIGFIGGVLTTALFLLWDALDAGPDLYDPDLSDLIYTYETKDR